METQKVKRIIDAGGNLPVENDPGGFSLDLLFKQPDNQGYDLFTLVRNEEKVFATGTETKILVKEIPGSFQALMSDMQLADKMVRDIKKYQSATD